MSDAGEKARRRAAREMIGDYHARELRALLEHVRDGFVRLDARGRGEEIDWWAAGEPRRRR